MEPAASRHKTKMSNTNVLVIFVMGYPSSCNAEYGLPNVELDLIQTRKTSVIDFDSYHSFSPNYLGTDESNFLSKYWLAN